MHSCCAHLPLDLCTVLLLGHGQWFLCLKVDPELGARAEIAAEAQRQRQCIRGQTARL